MSMLLGVIMIICNNTSECDVRVKYNYTEAVSTRNCGRTADNMAKSMAKNMQDVNVITVSGRCYEHEQMIAALNMLPAVMADNDLTYSLTFY